MYTYTIKYQRRLHTVKAGETLGTVAEKYGTTAAYIKKLNKLSAPLAAGDMLYIGGLGRLVYTVRPLDTLESIARKFGVQSMSLRLLNDISDVYIGQKILID